MIKTSSQMADEWEAANPERAIELNDIIDSHKTMDAKRAFVATLNKEEKNGLLNEYMRRRENEHAPLGSLVRGKHHDQVNGHSFSFVVRNGDSTMHACHLGLATVIGQDGHGGCVRYLVLQPPWQNKEGTVVMFAEASSYELEVLPT